MTPNRPRVLGVIPARLASTRLPRKVLREIAGKPLLQWVYEAALRCQGLDALVIAADSAAVQSLCDVHHWPYILTSPDLPSGTDRLFAVSQHLPADIYVNIQGDEPLLHPDHVTELLAPFINPTVDVTTLRVLCRPEDISNPNAVKVVTALDNRALYFSRSPIPFHRDPTSTPTYWKHLGLYAYRHAALTYFASLLPTPLERTERLEQLRMLESNITLHVAATTHDTIGVDTEADLLRVEALLREHRQP
jgi:3-deoxy-manno-octulosonate cytidylyltransferase (CMP-KDO synthetase)